MVFNATYSKLRLRRREAWTLMELMAGIAIGALVSLAVCSAMIYSGRSFQGLNNYIELDQFSRRTLDRMMNDIRGASRVTYWDPASNALTLLDINGSQIQFVYSSANKTLTRTDSKSTTTLLKGCDRLAFSMFQRTPPTNGANWLWTNSVSFCKLVQVDWTCSRKSYPTTNYNTESIQTAKIVIRNEPSL